MIGKLITAKAAPWLLGAIVVLLGALALQHLVLSAAVTAAQGERDTAQADVAEIRAMKRLWPHIPGLQDRREDEARVGESVS